MIRDAPVLRVHLSVATSDVRTWIEQQRDPDPPAPWVGDDPMSRPRVTIGTFGDISYRDLASGKVEARARSRRSSPRSVR
jgi:hypothetical protein